MPRLRDAAGKGKLMSQLLGIGIIGLFGAFLLVLLIAAVAGIVHAIRESVRLHRRPPMLSFVLWGVSLFSLIAYIAARVLWNARSIDFYVLGRFGDFWQKFLLGAFFVCLTTATGFYVFLSFRTPAGRHGHDGRDDEDDEDDVLDEEDLEDLRRRAAMRDAEAKHNRISQLLSVAVPLVLDAFLIGLLIATGVIVQYKHNVTELHSPDGNRVIYVDNGTLTMNGYIQGSAPYVFTYEKVNPFMVAKLDRPAGQDAPSVLDVSEENLIWKEDRLRILYGNTYVDYFYYGVEPTEE